MERWEGHVFSCRLLSSGYSSTQHSSGSSQTWKRHGGAKFHHCHAPLPPSTGQVVPLSFIGKLLPLASSATLGEVTALDRKAGAREPLATRRLPTERSASFQRQLLNCGLNKLRRTPASCSLGPGGLERKPKLFCTIWSCPSPATQFNQP